MRRRPLLQALATLAAGTALPARAQATKVVFGYTAVTDFASVFVAREEGFFGKRGLDVELKFVPINSTIPAAIQSDSLHIGGPTPSVFLQSVAIRRIGAQTAALVGSTGPVITVFLAWWWLSEPLSGLQLAGTVLVMAGVLIVGRR